MNSLNYECEKASDALDDFVEQVTGVRGKIAQIAANQRAICSTLQRTAAALRDLAETTRK